MTEYHYHYQSITEKRTGWRLSRWLLKLLILPIEWVCASEKRTRKNSILYFTREFHNFTKEFYTLYIQIFPEFTQQYKKVFYHELSSPENASKKWGRLVLFLSFPSAATFSSRQRYQSLKRMIICWRKKFKVLYVLHKKDRKKVQSANDGTLKSYRMCKIKCRRCVLVLVRHIVVLSASHLFSFLDTEKPKYLRTVTLKLTRASEMSQTLRLLLLCISC